MTSERIRREPVSDQVFARLRDAILSGRHPAGEGLPAERELAGEFGVNRHAVREAMKRLQQARLVEVAQGGRTRVLDWRRTAGLDLAVSLADAGAGNGPDGTPAGPPPLALAGLTRDALEMRACVGADAARLCAERGSAEALAEIRAAADRYADAGPDLAALGEADVAWWRLVVEGSGNIAYLLAFNTLVSGALAVEAVPMTHRTAELLDVAAHRRLGALIAERDAAAAERLARELLTRSVRDAAGSAAGRKGAGR
jgi:DNA-binding FadR family transcriptional regulator